MKASRLAFLFALALMASPMLMSGERELHGFCFSSQVSLSQVRSHLQPILLDGEELHERGSLHCVEALIAPKRQSLFITWLGKRFSVTKTYQGMSTSFSTSEARSPCRLEVTKKVRLDSKERDLSVGRSNRILLSQNNEQEVSNSQLLLAPGKTGHINYEGDLLNVACHPQGRDRFLIELSFASGPSSISTSVELIRGQRINIGDVVKDLSGKNRTISTSGARDRKRGGTSNSTYFLSIK